MHDYHCAGTSLFYRKIAQGGRKHKACFVMERHSNILNIKSLLSLRISSEDGLN